MELLERKIDKFLYEWKNNPERKPLIVKGARQIGKTESIRAFGRANYESVLEMNFVLQKKFRNIFDDGYEVDQIIKNITILSQTRRCCFSTSFRNVPIAPLRSSHSAKTDVST